MQSTRWTALAMGLYLLFLAAGCHKSSSGRPPARQPISFAFPESLATELHGVAAMGSTVDLHVGDVFTARAFGTFTDGTEEEITDIAYWELDVLTWWLPEAAVMTFDSDGVPEIEATGEGQARLYVEWPGSNFGQGVLSQEWIIEIN